MKLFRISQSINNGYDTFDSAIVCAENAERAKWIHPGEYAINWTGEDNDAWCNAEDVQVEEIGVAKKGMKEGVILASFNAG